MEGTGRAVGFNFSQGKSSGLSPEGIEVVLSTGGHVLIKPSHSVCINDALTVDEDGYVRPAANGEIVIGHAFETFDFWPKGCVGIEEEYDDASS